jgi:hypothetical protein
MPDAVSSTLDSATPNSATPDCATPDCATPDCATPDCATPDGPEAPDRPEPAAGGDARRDGPRTCVGRWSRRVVLAATPLVVAAALGQAGVLLRDIILLRWPSDVDPWNPAAFISPLPMALVCFPALLAMVAGTMFGTADGAWRRWRGGTALVMVLLAGLAEFRATGLTPSGFTLDERAWAVQAGLGLAIAALATVAALVLRPSVHGSR